MNWKNNKILAVIPARGGSKGIPRKNLSHLAGRSLIAHVAAVVGALDWLAHAVLSTDDEEIAEEGRRNGLEVPFMRPAELSGDTATAVDTWRHAWLASEQAYGMRFDQSVLLQPTSPLRTPDDVEQAVSLLTERVCSSVVTVSRNPANLAPEGTFRIDERGYLSPYLADGLKYTSRQMVAAYYHRNGHAYAVTRASLVDRGSIIGDDTVALPIDRPVANIDEPIDLEWAEFLLQRAPA